MLPENWQRVQRLLLICAFKDENIVLQLAPALHLLCQILPDAEMRFLMVQENRYDVITCGSESKKSPIQPLSIPIHQSSRLITVLRELAFDAAIIFTTPLQSPFSFAYLCYLANIPIRLGQSLEFGGSVLSHCVSPPTEPVASASYHLHLLEAAGLTIVPAANITPISV